MVDQTDIEFIIQCPASVLVITKVVLYSYLLTYSMEQGPS